MSTASSCGGFQFVSPYPKQRVCPPVGAVAVVGQCPTLRPEGRWSSATVSSGGHEEEQCSVDARGATSLHRPPLIQPPRGTGGQRLEWKVGGSFPYS